MPLRASAGINVWDLSSIASEITYQMQDGLIILTTSWSSMVGFLQYNERDNDYAPSAGALNDFSRSLGLLPLMKN